MLKEMTKRLLLRWMTFLVKEEAKSACLKTSNEGLSQWRKQFLTCKENQGWGVGKAGGKLDIFHWNMLQPEDDSIRSKRVIQIIYIVLKDVLSFAIDDQIISSVRSLS